MSVASAGSVLLIQFSVYTPQLLIGTLQGPLFFLPLPHWLPFKEWICSSLSGIKWRRWDCSNRWKLSASLILTHILKCAFLSAWGVNWKFTLILCPGQWTAWLAVSLLPTKLLGKSIRNPLACVPPGGYQIIPLLSYGLTFAVIRRRLLDRTQGCLLNSL